MPSFRNNAVDPTQISSAFDSVAAMFKPVTTQELLAGAKAQGERAKNAAFADLYARAGASGITPEQQATIDRQAGIAGLYNPSASLTAVDRNNATSRQNNAADNTRALEQTRLQQRGETDRELLKPVQEGGTRFVPPGIASFYKIDPTQIGAVKVNEGQSAVLPGGQRVEGTAKPLSIDQVAARELQETGSPADRRAVALQGVPVEQIVDAVTGKPTIARRSDAVGQQPYADPGKAQVQNYKAPDGRTGTARLDGGKWVDTQTGEAIPANSVGFGATLQGGKDDTGLGAAGANSVTQKLLDMKALGTTLDSYERLISQDPNSIGIVGTVRGAVQDAGATLQEGAKLLSPLQQKFEQDVQNGIVDPKTVEKYKALLQPNGTYNDKIPQAQMLQLLLASQYAKFLDPNGRISNDRLEQVQNSLGHGSIMSNAQRTKATLAQMRQQLQAQQSYLAEANPEAAKALGYGAAAPAVSPAPAAPATPPTAAPGTRRKFTIDGTLQ